MSADLETRYPKPPVKIPPGKVAEHFATRLRVNLSAVEELQELLEARRREIEDEAGDRPNAGDLGDAYHLVRQLAELVLGDEADSWLEARYLR
jgi:hypothetical protein